MCPTKLLLILKDWITSAEETADPLVSRSTSLRNGLEQSVQPLAGTSDDELALTQQPSCEGHLYET